jgi:hypothetical protein
MTLKTFEELQLKVDAEVATDYLQKDKYIFTNGYESFLKPLELKRGIISFMNLTQTRFINLYLKLELKTKKRSNSDTLNSFKRPQQ